MSSCGIGSASQFPSRDKIRKLGDRLAAAVPSKVELADVEHVGSDDKALR
jgi:hypothetical protein